MFARFVAFRLAEIVDFFEIESERLSGNIEEQRPLMIFDFDMTTERLDTGPLKL